MRYIARLAESPLREALDRERSVLLLGPRQTGKTTLVGRLDTDLTVSFLDPAVRLRYERNPSLFGAEVEALRGSGAGRRKRVVIDEIQRIPVVMDVVQDLIDRKVATFVLTGSSARKLRRGGEVNLLPGRLLAMRLDPLVLAEAPAARLEDVLLDGSLPAIVTEENAAHREEALQSYVTLYLEEEVRAEAVVRNLGSFARFLELAAGESGRLVSFRAISQDVGVAHTTVAAYYQVLEDCLIVERVDPLLRSAARRRLTRSSKYLFFDLGVRRAAAHEGTRLPRETMGRLLEQWVGLELLRSARLPGRRWKVWFWRDADGPEVDWVLEVEGRYIPFEVKWTEAPGRADARGLQIFLDDYRQATRGVVVARIPRPLKLGPRLVAIPWQEMDRFLEESA